MKTRFPLSIVTIFAIALITVIAMLVLTPVVVAADIIPISDIKDDTHIGKEVTVSGVVVTISSNIDPSSILIHEPGDTGILTIDDGSGRMLVSSDPRLFKFHEGERIMVMGLYAGENLIYADRLSKSIERGYKDITVAELNKCPVCYYDASVRIKGKVARIELSSEKTELKIDDDTGTMDVEYRGEIEGIRIDDEVVVEGKFYRSKIYAFTVMLITNQTVSNQSITPESEEEPHPTVAPDSSIVKTPASAKTVKIFTSPLFIGLVILSVAVVVGIFVSIKVREWLMLKRYMK